MPSPIWKVAPSKGESTLLSAHSDHTITINDDAARHG